MDNLEKFLRMDCRKIYKKFHKMVASLPQDTIRSEFADVTNLKELISTAEEDHKRYLSRMTNKEGVREDD
jgi:hypothetical protein